MLVGSDVLPELANTGTPTVQNGQLGTVPLTAAARTWIMAAKFQAP